MISAAGGVAFTREGVTKSVLSRYHLLVIGLLATMIMVLNSVFIPFHAADDEDHFAIAYAASHFRIGPVPAPNPAISSGSYVDASLVKVIQRNFDAVRLNAKPKLGQTAWSGKQVYESLPASVYFPLVYLPQIVAIRTGEAAGLSVETTIYLARIANGMTALALIAFAMAFVPDSLGLFVILLLSLPKSLQIFASNSADPMDHGIVFGLLAFFCHYLSTNRTPKFWQYAVAAIGIVAIGGIRPPLTVIGLPIFYLALRRRDIGGMTISAAAMAIAVLWWANVLPLFQDLRCPNALPLGARILKFIDHGPHMIIQTLGQRGSFYWATFIGELGYGDARIGVFTPLPLWAYVSATIMLMLGAASLGDEKFHLEPMGKVVPVVAAALMVVGIFFSLSVACTVYGITIIEGVQGRYFLTPIMLVAVSLAAWLPRLGQVNKLIRLAVPVFLVSNFGIMVAEGVNLYWEA